MRFSPEVQKELGKINAQIDTVSARQQEIADLSKARRLEAFHEAAGCMRCRGRGWVVTWDTMDYLCGSAADYGDCPEKGCTPETRKASGYFPENSRYDHNRRMTWNLSQDMTEEERDEYYTTDATLVRLGNERQAIYDRETVRKGKLVEVVRKSRARNAAEVGVKGRVFWHGVNDYGTIKIGLMDTEGKKHWANESCVRVIAQTAGKEYEQKYDVQYPLLCKVVKKTNRAICVMTPGQNPFSGGEWIPWSQVLNADQVREQLNAGGKILKDGKPATVMIPPWLAKKKGYIRE